MNPYSARRVRTAPGDSVSTRFSTLAGPISTQTIHPLSPSKRQNDREKTFERQYRGEETERDRPPGDIRKRSDDDASECPQQHVHGSDQPEARGPLLRAERVDEPGLDRRTPGHGDTDERNRREDDEAGADDERAVAEEAGSKTAAATGATRPAIGAPVTWIPIARPTRSK